MDKDRHIGGHSVPSDVTMARVWAETLEDREAKRSGLPVASARLIVARKTGVPEGKLYSLRRNRLKSIGSEFLNRLGSRLIAELQHELAQVEHELQTYRAIGAHPDSGEVLSALASREKIRAALGLAVPSSAEGE